MDVRLATADDAPEVGCTLARGFGDDPVLTWVFAGPGTAAKLDAFFGFLAVEAFVPLGTVHLLPGCCAFWTPPSAPEWPTERDERFNATLAAACAPNDLERLGRMGAAMAEHHPTAPHWYLSVIAAEPAARGGGLGSQVLARSLEVVDDADMPAYLESTNPRNISLYLRHGFEVTGRIDIPDGPSMTAMWREARRG